MTGLTIKDYKIYNLEKEYDNIMNPLKMTQPK